MLPSPFSCLAADYWSITICYYIELCRPLQTKLTEMGGGWRATLPIHKVKTSSSLVTCVPLSACGISPPQLCQAPCTEDQGIYQKYSQANTHTNKSAKRLIMFFSLSSMTSRSNWFCFCETVYFSNFQPCLKPFKLYPYMPRLKCWSQQWRVGSQERKKTEMSCIKF